MHTFKLEVEDTIVDKVMMYLQQLPKDKVRVKEEQSKSDDFIEYLTTHPIQFQSNNEFLSRSESNAR